MLHRPFAALALFTTLAVALPAFPASPEASVDLGVRAYQARDYESALVDLENAVRALTTRERLEPFVEEGRLSGLEALETALVYLALTQFRLGDEEAARATIFRLAAAEEIVPTYARLPIGAEAAELEALAAALVPDVSLPANRGALVDDPTQPLPPVLPATPDPELTRPGRERIVAALAPALPGEPPAPTVVHLVTPEVVRSSPPPPPPTLIVTESVAEAAAAKTEVAPSTSSTRDALLALRKAEALVDNGLVAEANAIYATLARRAGTAREVLIEAATGLYRTGAYRDAVDAFRRFGTFARGEEDLRYYYSVALFESGDYRGAQHELRCALPFIRETDEVLRYAQKIERMQQASANTTGMH